MVGTTLAACKEEPPGPTPVTPGSGSSSSSSSSGQTPSPAQQPQASAEPLKPESYAPVITELGPEGAVPDKVIFEFPRTVSYPENDGKKTVVRFSPEVGGNLELSAATPPSPSPPPTASRSGRRTPSPSSPWRRPPAW